MPADDDDDDGSETQERRARVTHSVIWCRLVVGLCSPASSLLLIRALGNSMLVVFFYVEWLQFFFGLLYFLLSYLTFAM